MNKIPAVRFATLFASLSLAAGVAAAAPKPVAAPTLAKEDQAIIEALAAHFAGAFSLPELNELRKTARSRELFKWEACGEGLCGSWSVWVDNPSLGQSCAPYICMRSAGWDERRRAALVTREKLGLAGSPFVLLPIKDGTLLVYKPLIPADAAQAADVVKAGAVVKDPHVRAAFERAAGLKEKEGIQKEIPKA